MTGAIPVALVIASLGGVDAVNYTSLHFVALRMTKFHCVRCSQFWQCALADICLLTIARVWVNLPFSEILSL